MTITSPTELDAVLSAAAVAAPLLAAQEPRHRAAALVTVAAALDGAADELVSIAQRETGLAEARLRGELRRTSVQLRLFADVIVDGAYLDVRLDAADPDFVLGPRPDLRRYLAAVGPVLNFAASNFPFAFSVLGGDTAAALAAGCPVVVKAHTGHLELSEATARVARAALAAQGLPDGTLAIIAGRDAGVAALRDPRITAAAFTGSTEGGLRLADIAASRPVPIPFFGELGSVNPVFVTRAAAEERGERIAAELVASVSGSAGQLCTKPGFVFVPRGAFPTDAVATASADLPEHRLLYPGIGAAFVERRATILAADGVSMVVDGDVRTDDDGQTWATPTFALTDVATLVSRRDQLLDEAFGPLAVIVEYDDADQLAPLVAECFPGNLTGTVHTGHDEDAATHTAIVAALAVHSGRVVFNGWPTGVAVTPAMIHGGPFPATTGFGGTSVGTTSIARFLRPVTFQSAPEAILPPPLRDDNPWGVPQALSGAGESALWGRAVTEGAAS